MITEYVNGFADAGSGSFFQGGMLFRSGGRCLLHGRDGHIVLMEGALADQLLDREIPGRLYRALRSRGFLGNDMADSPCPAVRPEFFMIDLTSRCNMACRYCLRDVSCSGGSMKESVLKQICEYITKYCEDEKLADVSIQAWGGEPLLELPSVLNMKKWIRPKHTKVHFSVETNAVLLNDTVLDQLYENRIGIGVSIDGTKECHDAQRVWASGEGNHALVEANLKRALSRYGSRLGTITTVTKLNAEKLDEILEYYAAELGLENVKFNFVHKSRFACGSEELCLSEEEIAEAEKVILRKMAELAERGYSLTEKNICTKIRNLLFFEYSDICLSRGCAGGRKMIVFDRDGRIYPCELTDFPEESIGSIYQNDISLIEMVKKGIGCRDYFIPKTAEKCMECQWYAYCGGGCTVRIMNAGGRPPETDDIECAVNRALYPEIIDMILNKPQVINRILGYEAVVF